MLAIKAIFDILSFENILANNVQKFYLNKLSLLIILLIDNYNYNINSVNIANQL